PHQADLIVPRQRDTPLMNNAAADGVEAKEDQCYQPATGLLLWRERASLPDLIGDRPIAGFSQSKPTGAQQVDVTCVDDRQEVFGVGFGRYGVGEVLSDATRLIVRLV